MSALYIVLPSLCILAIAYRYYSAFIARASGCSTTAARRRRTRSTTAPTTTRPSGGCCSATTSPPSPAPARWSARCWPRSSAGRPGFIWLVAGVCLAGAVHDSMVLWASTRRGGQVAGRSREDRDRPGRRRRRHRRHPVHPDRRAGRPGHRRGQRAGRERLGHVHDRHDDPDRDLHGLLHVRLAQGPHRRSHRHRRHRHAGWPWSAASRSNHPDRGSAASSTCRARSSSSRSASTASSPRCCRCGCCWRRAATSARS